MQEKTKKSSGADERTPSIPQYFSWINNTNEGATEEQTLINLNYFKWLRDTYGMELKIYAWDAGNLDGAGDTYAHPAETPKLLKQYPNGYKPSADAAAEFGCHLGVWGGADGFGNTPEEEANRYELIVSLCRDLGFMLFKFDTVCGNLREEKRMTFKKMIDECRKYVPDLIVLNHRNNLGEAEICATTFLWGGQETYIDAHLGNSGTGAHHRVAPLERGLVPEMKRLTEDHGVCLSSYLDYFEDDLVIQAFARSLILAPEIYGNPWLLRDAEQARLAKIYNLHRKYADILVDGIALPESYGKNAAARGNGSTRLITLANPTWETKKVTLSLNEEIGLKSAEDKKFVVKTLHPYESLVSVSEWGDNVEVTVDPFRAALILVQEYDAFIASDYVLTGCRYETLYGANAKPSKALIYAIDGSITLMGNEVIDLTACRLDLAQQKDATVSAPVCLGELTDCTFPENAEQLYEATCFAASSDSFEAQSLKRSGETKIPQVKEARDAFFAQDTYRYRGVEARYMFDGDKDSFFDGNSKNGSRLEGGCLRVDLGEVFDIDRIEIECFAINEPIREVKAQSIPEMGETSTDLADWKNAPLTENAVLCDCTSPVVVTKVHNIITVEGKRLKATYNVSASARYFRLDAPMDRIYSFKAFDKAGKEITLAAPKANNLLMPYAAAGFTSARTLEVTVPETTDTDAGAYIAVAFDGVHGREGVYCAAECEGMPIGFNDRARTFPINAWEHGASATDRGYTYYLALTPDLLGKKVKLTALFRPVGEGKVTSTAWLCDGIDKKPIGEIGLV